MLNEHVVLRSSIERIVAYLATLPYSWRVTIVDNGSTDGTWQIATELAGSIPGVRALRLAERGRGRALRAAWCDSDAGVVAYTDIDLSFGLNGFLPLVSALLTGHSDVAIGSRVNLTSRVARIPKREVISHIYNLLLRVATECGFSEAQSGFKAARAEVARELAPRVRAQKWFFDTEMLLLAEQEGLRIHEVAVDYVDDLDSRVNVRATGNENLLGLTRLTTERLRRRPSGRPAAALACYLLLGVATIVLHAGLFLAMDGSQGAVAANALALSVATVVGTLVTRVVVFGRTNRVRWLRDGSQARVFFAAALVATSLAIGAIDAASDSPRAAAVIIIVVIDLVALVARSALAWAWIFQAKPPPSVLDL